MLVACKHNIPEDRKGIGPCDIISEVKNRQGKPQWWCVTHGSPASAPDGAALEECPNAWFDPVAPERQHDLHVGSGEFSVWGALPPAISIGEVPKEPGNVHVHHRPLAGADKDIDSSYDIVRVHNGDEIVVVENMAAVAASISELAGSEVVVLRCRQARCGSLHIDEQKFAATPHRKHQCNQCGRNFWEPTATVGNPLADAYERLGLIRPAKQQVHRPLLLDRSAFSAIALWASNAAIVSTRTSVEDVGVHVHAWDHDGKLVIDETHSPVILDGEAIDEGLLRILNVQRALVHDVPIRNVACSGCGSPLVSPSNGWMDPNTKHVCPSCGSTTRTARRSFLNPLADK